MSDDTTIPKGDIAGKCCHLNYGASEIIGMSFEVGDKY